MAELTGDALIAYGFKRIIEELQELRGAVTVLTSAIDGMALDNNKTALNTKDTLNACKRLEGTLDKLEHNTFMMNDSLAQSASDLTKIQANTFTAEMNCIRLAHELRKDTGDEQRLGGI